MINWYECEVLAREKREDMLREAAAWRLAQQAGRRAERGGVRRRLAAALLALAARLAPAAPVTVESIGGAEA